jgi:hypothetical protein
MAQQETYKINVESNAAEVTREVDEAVKDLKQSVDSVNSSASSSLDNVSQSAEKAADNIGKSASGMKDLAEESVDVKEGVDGAVTVLDQFTGGLAGMLVNVTRGFKAFGKTSVASFKASIAGANGLKKALIATGIGALVVAVGMLVAYWDDIVGFISGASTEQKELLAATEATATAAQDRLTATEGSENSLKLQGKSEREIRDLKIQQTEEVILATKAQLEQQKQMKKAQVEAAERNQKIAAGVIAFLTAPITILLGAVDALTFGLKQVGVLEEATSLAEEYLMDAASLVGFDAEETEAEADATIKETEDALRALENKRDGYILSNQQADQAAADQASADAKAAAEKKEQDEKAAAEKLAALKEEIRKAEANTQEEIRQQELEDTEKYYEDLYFQAVLNGLDTEELEKTKAEKLAELKARYRQEDLDAEQKLEDDKQAIIYKNDEEAQQRRSDAIQMIKDSFDAMSALADAFAGESEEQQRRNFNIQKALSAANVVVGTIEGASNAYTTAQKSPFTAFFPGYPLVQAGLATAFGVAQLQQIRKSKFEGSTPDAPSSAGGGAGTAMAGTTPSFNIVGGSGANVIAESLSKTPLKAYVVGSDVTTQQELDRKQIKSATL